MAHPIDPIDSLRDLVMIADEAVALATQVAAWLRTQCDDTQALDRFLARPTLPVALEIEKDMSALDARLRHNPVNGVPTHRLVARLGAMKRIAADLRAHGADTALLSDVLEGHQSLLEIRPLLPSSSGTAAAPAPLGPLAPSEAGARVSLVLVVEDDDWWRARLESKVKDLFPQAACETFASYQGARERFDELARQKGILVVLDLGLPESESSVEADQTSLGLDLLRMARAYENLWRVVVVTRPRNYLQDQVVATRLGVQPEDYIFKIDEAWEADVEQSLRRLSEPTMPRIDIVCEDGVRRATVRAGDVQFTIDGRPFLVLRSLAEAHGQKADEDLIFNALERMGEATMGVGLSDTLLKLRRAFVEAGALVGRAISPEDVVRTGDIVPGRKPVYHLVPPARMRFVSDDAAPPAVVANRVLVVDDDPLAANELAGWLRRLGLEVRTSDCHDEALRVAAEFQPHMLCLDLALPRLARGAVHPEGGLAFLDEVRSLPGLADVRVVVVSVGAHDDKTRRRGLLRGIRVDDWLQKGDELLQSWFLRSMSRLRAEIEMGVVLSVHARSPHILEISRSRRWAALDGHDLGLSRSAGGFQFLEMLAERAYLPVSIDTLADALGLGMTCENRLRNRAKRLREAANEDRHAEDTFIKGFAGGYVLRASVVWVE